MSYLLPIGIILGLISQGLFMLALWRHERRIIEAENNIKFIKHHLAMKMKGDKKPVSLKDIREKNFGGKVKWKFDFWSYAIGVLVMAIVQPILHPYNVKLAEWLFSK